MLPTKSFSSLKGILPKIHQPLPLNEKSTKKLLDTLTTSFRKHLDREHGWLDEETGAAPAAKAMPRSSRHSQPVAAAGSAVSSSPDKDGHLPKVLSSPHHQHHSRRPTDRHVRSILSNPLFSYDRTVGNQASHGAERDPMDIFDWAVARGMMTTKRAAGCLMAKQREIMQSPNVSAKASMAASGAGRKVLQWLRSSGLERNLSFINDTQLTTVLIQFLAAEEGLDAVVWLWIERLQRGEGPQVVGTEQSPSSRISTSASFVLDKLVKAIGKNATTLDDAYLAMRRGADLFDKTTPAFERNIFWPWCYLSWMSTFKAWNLASPTPRLYETFVSIMDHDDRPSIRLERAHLDLRHPTQPTPAPAVALLNNDHLLEDVQRSTPPPGSQPKRILLMGLDTVRHLALIGESGEAQRVLDRLREHFGGAVVDRMPILT